MVPDVPLVTGPELSRTYSHPSYADPWECVEDYVDVIEYAGRNPDAGRGAVGEALDLPPSRCRTWLEGGIPDPVRAVRAAAERDWLDVRVGDPTFRGLNVLVAWVFSGGSINRHFAPYFSVDDSTERTVLDRAAALVGVELDFTRSPAEAGRAIELRPIRGASVLGRVLHLLGAPVGAKNETTSLSLPEYLPDAPRRIRREFVQVYVENRGSRRGERGTLTMAEDRPRPYLRSLADLVSDLTGRSVTVSGTRVVVPAAAARRVDRWPAVLSGVEADPDRQSGDF